MLTGNPTAKADSPQKQDQIPTVASPSTWAADRLKEKGPEYYNSLKEGYKKFISGNELLAVLSVLEAINTRTIFLQTTDMKSKKLIGVSREALKSLNVGAKVFARRYNAMWDILLGTEEAAKSFPLNREVTNRIHGHTENTNYLARCVHVHYREPFGGLLFKLRTVWGCLVSKEQGRHCHQ